jgi:hypothetical protein
MNLLIPHLIIAYKTKLGHLTLTVHYAMIKSVISTTVSNTTNVKTKTVLILK